MNIKHLMLVGLAAVTLALAGCAGTGGTRSGQGAEVVNGSAGAGSGSGTVTQGASGGNGSWSGTALTPDQQQLLNDHVVYFAFDSSAIDPQYLPLLKAHAAMLNANPSQHVTIQGNTDERGTREYNIALGERRAKAVEAYLEAEGVNPAQISTISFGEERPVALGHNPAAWAKNRRAVLVD